LLARRVESIPRAQRRFFLFRVYKLSYPYAPPCFQCPFSSLKQMREVNEASQKHWVVCHLYADHVANSDLAHALLERFARTFKAVKCLRIKVRDGLVVK